MPCYTSPFGDESLFENEDRFVTGINFQRLFEAIKQHQNREFNFYYKEFESKSSLESIFDIHSLEEIVHEGKKVAENIIPLNRPALPPENENVYHDFDKKEDYEFTGMMNMRPGTFSISKPHIGFGFELNLKKRIFYLSDYFYYLEPAIGRQNSVGLKITADNYPAYQSLSHQEGLVLNNNSIKVLSDRFIRSLRSSGKSSSDLTWLYFKVPEFVLSELEDSDLVTNFNTMSANGLDSQSGHEYIAILKLLSAAKDHKLWVTAINKNPLGARKVFQEFDAQHEQDLIEAFTKIGSDTWAKGDLENAVAYKFESTEFDSGETSPDIVIDSICEYKENKNKFLFGYVVNIFDKNESFSKESKLTDTTFLDAFSPVKIVGGDRTVYIPAVIAEYFTGIKIEKQRKELINFSLQFLLPELSGSAVKAGIIASDAEQVQKDIKILTDNPLYKKILDGYAGGEIKRIFQNVLTVEEEAAIRYYTTNEGYKRLNSALRGKIKLTEEFRAQERIINAALDKLPVSEYNSNKALLYRIEDLTDNEIGKIYPVGKIITNKSFTSATHDMFAISEAMKRRSYTVLLRIEGKNGKLIEELSSLESEREILFKSNTRFFVSRISESTSPKDFAAPIKTIFLKEN